MRCVRSLCAQDSLASPATRDLLGPPASLALLEPQGSQVAAISQFEVLPYSGGCLAQYAASIQSERCLKHMICHSGSTGFTGDTGFTGVSGFTGDTGFTGATGALHFS